MEQGPYRFQRLRHRLGEYPRPPQPAIQPNQLPPTQGWGGDTMSYWGEVFSDYLKKRKSSGGK